MKKSRTEKHPPVKPGKNAPLAQRFAWVMDVVYAGSQGEMAKALGCSQSYISRIIRGRQHPGAKLLMNLADLPALNRTWVLTGEGEPLASQMAEYDGDAALPIACQPFRGLPYDHPLDLEDVLYPVPRQLHRKSRYWVRMTPEHPFVHDENLKIAACDMLLFDADQSAWPDNLLGRPCLADVSFGGTQQLLFCRCDNPSISNPTTTNDFDFYKQIPGSAENKKSPRATMGRNRRSIILDGHLPSKSEELLLAVVHIVAVAVFRCGRLE